MAVNRGIYRGRETPVIGLSPEATHLYKIEQKFVMWTREESACGICDWGVTPQDYLLFSKGFAIEDHLLGVSSCHIHCWADTKTRGLVISDLA